ncbi:vesicle-fusing ATPase 1 [Eurytemora carolleeae]|uniref:vesicle-fusing ATPase 1 n=1 Tax=Eurytemora carolleeae TaxID=1294199 RepID=UPI000C78EDCF|nr:vesicle-fusing ATPase 1 [Eurytemora carolleeae]|eukprot:XP_023322671.1 vesicle-fusing ATPase 1-like [Eurytemora affinis]
MSRTMKVSKCPELHSKCNRAVANPSDFNPKDVPHVEVRVGSGESFIFSLISDPSIPNGELGFSMPQRKWAQLSINQDILVSPYWFDKNTAYISQLTVEIDYFTKKNNANDEYNSDEMAGEFLNQFGNLALTQGQQMVFGFSDKKLLVAVVKSIQCTDISNIKSGTAVKSQEAVKGILLPNSAVIFEKMEGSLMRLTGKSKGKIERQSIINPDWDFTKMGIGGLGTEFNAIFRRAFASRVFPPEIMEDLGCKHVKGILLHGPPGTGKTLMARQIGKMLNAREPKIVNGPEILDKYVGESEANIRKLFQEAEEDERKLGVNSGLHIIIFDEIDAICKTRGSVAGNTGVNDTVVNQLLSKIDGVDQLNNILVIGMTNRKDMIDDALLRPGRLEVQVEIGLPKEDGRLEILNIHTGTMRKNEKLAADVDLLELSKVTKNFSGAEIEGLVRAAQSCALNRLVRASSKVEVDSAAAEKLSVCRADFMHALENDIKPAFGSAQELLEGMVSRGVMMWGDEVQGLLDDAKLLVQQAASQHGPGLVSILIEGAPNSGKTALAATLAKESGFPFIKICSPEDMVGFTESAKCLRIKKVFEDAYRSSMSCILVDNIERLLDYGPIGPRYSNITLQALLVLLKKLPPAGKRLLIIATSSRREVLDQMEMLPAFTDVLHLPNLHLGEQVLHVVRESGAVSAQGLQSIEKHLRDRRCNIGVKKLLDMLDMVRQTSEENRADKLVSKLESEGLIDFSD